MKKLIVIIALLVASQAWGEMSRDAKRAVTDATQCELWTNGGMDGNARIESFKKEDCGALDKAIKKAASGDDEIYDALMEAINKMSSSDKKSTRDFAATTERRIQSAQQRAIMKSKQTEAK